MNNTILKITTLTLFAAALSILSPSLQAADTVPAASTNTPAAAPDTAGPAKFYGPVSAVDTTAKTFTVGDQTYIVTAETHMTKDSKPATLGDATVGEPARGSYTKGKDGKLNVTKVRFGKAGSKNGGSGGSKSGGKKKKDTSATSTNAPASSAENP